jgi:alpha-ketoglutarate-dependent taurine dioxygenase
MDPTHVQELHPLFGAYVTGLNLAGMRPSDSAAALLGLVDRYGLILLKSQRLSPQFHVEIARHMGPVEVHRRQAYQLPEFPEVFRVAWTANDGHVGLGCYWHCDGCARVRPTRYSIYHPVIVPPCGGQTDFADSAAVWKSFPRKLRERLQILNWCHTSGVFHPFVRLHPTSHSLHLIVNLGQVRCVDGLTREESNDLLSELAGFIDQSGAVWRHHWSEHDVLVADNWKVLHRATAPVEGERRVLHRVSVLSI